MREPRKGPLRHPFRDFAKVTHRTVSRTLQRRIVDFSAERSFQKTADALREHYQIEVPLYAIDKATGEIGKQAKSFNSQLPESIKPADTLISQVDGSMLPIVGFREEPSGESVPERTDRRKLRSCHWKEIRVSPARVPGSTETWYGVTLGEPLAVGLMMSETCAFNGMHEATHIHAVGDGAPWIAEQYERQFGTRCKFHLDLYHVCDYLAAAIQSAPMSSVERKQWLEEQKQSLKASCCQDVINALRKLPEPQCSGDETDPVTAAIQYLDKRRQQLDYREAIRQELPIGSGEVESAHRHVLQKRLKIPGAWWRLKRAEEMAQLRAMRANRRWDEFWKQQAA